eukprot:1732906-Pleurochrysis_carterae.AAC.2
MALTTVSNLVASPAGARNLVAGGARNLQSVLALIEARRRSRASARASATQHTTQSTDTLL